MTVESAASEHSRALPRVVVILLGVAAFFVAVAGMRNMSGLVGDTFLALVFVIAVHPLRAWIERKGLPGWLGGVLGIVLIYVTLMLFTVALVVAVARFASLVPEYRPQIQSGATRLTNWLSTRGLGQKQIESIINSLDPSKVVSVAAGFINRLVSLLSNLFFVVILVLFMVVDAAHIAQKLVNFPSERQRLAVALESFAVATRWYLVVSTVFGLICAVLDVGALLLIGVPAALLWGLLAFVTNYVPNIGFIIGIVPPAFIALLQGGLKTMIAVVIAYVVINFVIQTLIQPKVVGDSVGLSPTTTMISLVLWAYVLGPVGALMAVPLTLLTKALLVDADERSAWVGPLLTGTAHDKPSGRKSHPKRRTQPAKPEER